jgi:dihydroneopterin aldolase
MASASIELRQLEIGATIGTYGPDDVVPDKHLLDLTLAVDAQLVLIAEDGMDHVFDYDPLMQEIDRLAKECHYDTQERLMTRIIDACAGYPEIEAMELRLCKTPVRNGSGLLGVRASVSGEELRHIRNREL